MYLCPSDEQVIGPMMSTQTVENGVPIIGNFPIGAFAIVPFETFL